MNAWKIMHIGRKMRQCKGKVRHKSSGAALAHVRSLAEKDRDRMNHYYCVYCKNWHVGHKR